MGGVDRSATVVAAFCMASFDVSTTQAREGLKRLRPACTEQVPAYEELLRTNESKIRRFFDSLNYVQNKRPVVGDMEIYRNRLEDPEIKISRANTEKKPDYVAAVP